MIATLTAADLIAFEKRIAERFNAGEIRAPIHLDGGNEEAYLDVFRHVHPMDWVCGQWRMHYACLLKGVPPERLEADIVAGRSIALCYPEHRIVSSAIAGGILPIALGIAWREQRFPSSKETVPKVWCFIGDMTARMGIAEEVRRYRYNAPLLQVVVMDNGKSVCTPTDKAWPGPSVCGSNWRLDYKPTYPHSGAGQRVNF